MSAPTTLQHCNTDKGWWMKFVLSIIVLASSLYVLNVLINSNYYWITIPLVVLEMILIRFIVCSLVDNKWCFS